MGEYFNLRSRMLLYEYIRGTSNAFNSTDSDKLQRNSARWRQLPSATQKTFLEEYENLQGYAQRPFLIKIKEGIEILFKQIPRLELAWILLASLLSILLLLKIEGVKHAAWLLPLVVCAYAIDNQMNGENPKKSRDAHLFPTESYLVEQHLKEPFSSSIEQQRKQLQQAWEAYLVDQWSSDNTPEDGEYNFTISRLQALGGLPLHNWKSDFNQKHSLFTLVVYLMWNYYFARKMNRRNYPENFDHLILERRK